WRDQRPLAEHYRLQLIDRRGFGASLSDDRVDFERDAEDVEELLGDGAHLVGHSYGGVVSLLAAARRPDAVRSLALIEPPAFGVARGDAAVEQLIRNIEAAASSTQDPAEYRALFLRGFGASAGSSTNACAPFGRSADHGRARLDQPRRRRRRARRDPRALEAALDRGGRTRPPRTDLDLDGRLRLRARPDWPPLGGTRGCR